MTTWSQTINVAYASLPSVKQMVNSTGEILKVPVVIVHGKAS